MRLFFLLLYPALFAEVTLQTSINDVYIRGNSELPGSLTMIIDGDDFVDAAPHARNRVNNLWVWICDYNT